MSDRDPPGAVEAEDRASASPSTPSSRQRFVEIDTLKTAGIVSVILIHSMRAPWDPRVSDTELALGAVTRFAVPAFLFCSGFLYATSKPIPWSVTRRRLKRVLVPYLVCSIAAQAWWLVQDQAHSLGTILDDLLLASSFGPYYYVFVHFFLVLLAPLFAILPRTALAVLTGLLLGSQGWLESRTGLILPVFWHIRNPLLWWGYFLLGWEIRIHYGEVRSFITAHRSLLTGILVLAVLGLSQIAMTGGETEWYRGATWLCIHAIIALVFVSTCGRKREPDTIAALSDASYAIYLLHLFFIYAIGGILQPDPGSFDLPVVAIEWSAGLFGSISLSALSRRVLGRRSRDIIGA